MRSLRVLVLMLAVGAFPGLLMQAHAQQEVDPDHYDQPAVTAKANTSHKSVSVHHQGQGKVKMASKRSTAKANRHRAHVAA